MKELGFAKEQSASLAYRHYAHWRFRTLVFKKKTALNPMLYTLIVWTDTARGQLMRDLHKQAEDNNELTRREFLELGAVGAIGSWSLLSRGMSFSEKQVNSSNSLELSLSGTRLCTIHIFPKSKFDQNPPKLGEELILTYGYSKDDYRYPFAVIVSTLEGEVVDRTCWVEHEILVDILHNGCDLYGIVESFDLVQDYSIMNLGIYLRT